MDEPRWLLDEVVTAIHKRQLAEHGGLDGVRDPGMLSSPLARPKNVFVYSQPKPDLAALAAAYAFGISKNHPFVDGNKRVGYAAMETFLIVNGFEIEAGVVDQEQIILGVASGTIDRASFTDWVSRRMIQLSE